MISRATLTEIVLVINSWEELHGQSPATVHELLTKLAKVTGNKSWTDSINAVLDAYHEQNQVGSPTYKSLNKNG